MSTKAVAVEILCNSSKSFDPKLKGITLGKYNIRTIPTQKEAVDDSHERVLLEFEYMFGDRKQITAQPLKIEGDYALSILSLILEMKVEFDSMKVGNVQTTLMAGSPSFLMGRINLPSDINELYAKLFSLDLNVLRQFLRSCNVYRSALSLIEDNPTLAFFLFVTSIESISGIVIKKSSRKNFEQFILTYIPKSFEHELESKELLSLLIKRAWKIRCSFTHGGSNISAGALVADQANRNYVKHKEKNKVVYSPSTSWLAHVVRNVLLEFLRTQKIGKVQESKFSEIAVDASITTFIAAKQIKPGQMVTASDLDLDF